MGAENLIRPGPDGWGCAVGRDRLVADAGAPDVDRSAEVWRPMVGRVAAAGLPGCDQYLRDVAAAGADRSGQGRRDPRAPSPDHGAAASPRPGQGTVHSGRQSVAGRVTARPPARVLGRMRLPMRPDTVLRWHRDVLARRHATASRPKRRSRPPTVRSIRLLALRLARENPGWGYRRIHGELPVLGVAMAASTVWKILHEAGIGPADQRVSSCGSDQTAHRPVRRWSATWVTVDFRRPLTRR